MSWSLFRDSFPGGGALSVEQSSWQVQHECLEGFCPESACLELTAQGSSLWASTGEKRVSLWREIKLQCVKYLQGELELHMGLEELPFPRSFPS